MTEELNATETTRYTIPEMNMEALAAGFAKIAKKAAKLNVPAPAYTVISERLIEKYEMLDGEVQTEAYPTGEFYKAFIIEVTGEAPKLNGWSLLAVIQHDLEDAAALNIIRRFPGAAEGVEVPAAYRNARPGCVHCNTARNRKDTYLVINAENEIKEIGSNCLKDFTGHESPEAVANFLQYILSTVDGLAADDEFLGGRGGNGPAHYNLERYLSWVAKSIAAHGWVSKGKAQITGQTATAADADNNWYTFNKQTKGTLGQREERIVEPTETDVYTAYEAIKFVRALPETKEYLSEYEWNLVAAFAKETTIARNYGIVASGVAAYLRDQEVQITRKYEAATSEYIAEAGAKVTGLKVTVASATAIDGNYGTTYLFNMRDDKGNVIKWFASNWAMEVAGTYIIKGTVKACEEYKGTKQTILTRCKVIEEVITEEAGA